MTRYVRGRGLLVAFAMTIPLAACASAGSATVQSKAGTTTVQSKSTAVGEPQELPDYQSSDAIGVAGPDGEMVEGLRVSTKDLEERVIRIHTHMARSDISSATPEQSEAFSFVDASPVVNERGELAGYFSDRYYPLAEYERLLPDHQRVVDAAGG